MQGKSGTHSGVTAFALIGVRCTRLEHGYLPQNYYHNQLPPIYEDAITGNPEPNQRVSTLRRSPSPINVLTNGSFYDVDKSLPRRSSQPSNVRQTTSMRRNSCDIILNSSRMLNDMIGRKYRRKSDPCLSSYKQKSLDTEPTLETSSSNSSLESLVIDVEGGNGVRRKDQSEVMSSKARSSIYGCSTEKKIRKKLFLLCFGIFVTVVLFFLISIMTGLLFPRAMFNNDQTAYVYPQTQGPDITTRQSLQMNNDM